MMNILVLGIDCPTDEMISLARNAALHAMPIPCGGSCRIITGDGYGIEAEVARVCIYWRIPLLIVGTALKPSNGAVVRGAFDQRYERVITTTRSVAQRREERNRYLLNLAHYVVFLGQEHHEEMTRMFAQPQRELC